MLLTAYCIAYTENETPMCAVCTNNKLKRDMHAGNMSLFDFTLSSVSHTQINEADKLKR